MAIHSKLPALVQRCVILAAALVLTWAGAAAAAGGMPPIHGAVANFIPARDVMAAPDLTFRRGDGKTLTLADFRGKVVLLNLWATWCAPCRREMSDLDRLQAQLGGPRFAVVALSSDHQGFDAVDKFFAAEQIRHLTRYNDSEGRMQRALDVLGLPTSFVIDPQGQIVGKLVGPADWASPEAAALLRHYMN